MVDRVAARSRRADLAGARQRSAARIARLPPVLSTHSRSHGGWYGRHHRTSLVPGQFPANCREIETTVAQALLAFAQLLTEELMQEIAAASSFLAVLLDRYSIYDSRRVATLHDVPDHHADVALTVLADMGLRWLAPPAIQQDVGGLYPRGI